MTRTNGLRYLPELDGLRALAVAVVVAAHAGLPLTGGNGVTVFFVISGYLITALLLAEHARSGGIALRGFYRRRAARLVPALVVVLTCTVAWLVVVGVPFRQWAYGLLGSLTYTTNILDAAAPDRVDTYFEYTWSLAVEEQFYLLWPAVLLLVLRRARSRRRALIALCLGGMLGSWAFRLLMIATRASDKTLAFSLPSHLDALALGALIAVLTAPSLRDGRATRSCRVRRWGAVLRGKPLVHLGRLSYGLYLWNMLCTNVFREATGVKPVHGGWWAMMWLLALLSIAELSHRIVEEPLRRRWSEPLDRDGRRRRDRHAGFEEIPYGVGHSAVHPACGVPDTGKYGCLREPVRESEPVPRRQEAGNGGHSLSDR